ncbi:MAG: DinB family protein [Flavobacteriales bacterium]|nr:DinB family protein [Flavobacteriales bacterium]
MTNISKPTTACGWLDRYIGYVPDQNLASALRNSAEKVVARFGMMSHDQLQFRYAEGKWSPQEILAHLIDSEQVFAYRAMRFSRRDATPLSGFDENDYVEALRGSLPSVEKLLEGYKLQRSTSMLLFESMNDSMLDFEGTANGNVMSARCLGFAIAGHDLHHLEVIAQRYLIGG